MRFHKFEGKDSPIWIDLDEICAVYRDADDTTAVLMRGIGTAALVVRETPDDIVALFQPMPDPYEEELARIKREGPPERIREGDPAADHEAIGEGMRDAIRRRMPHDPAPWAPGREKHQEGLSDPFEPARKAGWAAPSVITTYQAHARLDELERTTAAFWGHAEAYRPKWVKEFQAARKAAIGSENGTGALLVTTLPAEEMLSLGIAARRDELIKLRRWFENVDAHSPGLLDYIRARLRMFEKGEV
jgi:hypothetical protein